MFKIYAHSVRVSEALQRAMFVAGAGWAGQNYNIRFENEPWIFVSIRRRTSTAHLTYAGDYQWGLRDQSGYQHTSAFSAMKRCKEGL